MSAIYRGRSGVGPRGPHEFRHRPQEWVALVRFLPGICPLRSRPIVGVGHWGSTSLLVRSEWLCAPNRLPGRPRRTSKPEFDCDANDQYRHTPSQASEWSKQFGEVPESSGIPRFILVGPSGQSFGQMEEVWSACSGPASGRLIRA